MHYIFLSLFRYLNSGVPRTFDKPDKRRLRKLICWQFDCPLDWKIYISINLTKTNVEQCVIKRLFIHLIIHTIL